MGLSRLSAGCRACPYVNTCDHKRMEGLGYLLPTEKYMPPENISPSAETAASNILAPVLVKHDYRDIKIAEGTTVTIDLEDIKKQMRSELYKDLRLMSCT